MKKTEKMLLGAGLLLLASLLGTGATWAYFTYFREIRNRFTVGWNGITVTEEYDPPEEIVPGKETSFGKKVQIRNTGSVPCYVRVRLEYSDAGMEQFCTHVLNGQRASAQQWERYAEEFSGGAWVYGEDGCYYYRDPLKPGQKTALLLEEVEVSVPADGEELLSEFEILVYGESVQTMIHRTGPDGELSAEEAADYREAWDQMTGGEKGGDL